MCLHNAKVMSQTDETEAGDQSLPQRVSTFLEKAGCIFSKEHFRGGTTTGHHQVDAVLLWTKCAQP